MRTGCRKIRDGEDGVGTLRDAIGAEGVVVLELDDDVADASGSLCTACASKPIVPSTPVPARASSNVVERGIDAEYGMRTE